MFKEFDRNQDLLFPADLREMIQDNDLAFTVAETVDLLDLRPLYRSYSSLGQNAYHPGMLLALLIYAYSQGVVSVRKIAERVRCDVRFMYIAGMQQPDFRTISDFRNKHKKLFSFYFRQTLKICLAAGLVKLDQISIDGSKLQASASRKQVKDRSALDKELALLDKEIDRILAFAEEVARNEPSHDDKGDSDILRKLDDAKKRRDKLLAAKKQFDNNDKLKKVNLTDPDSRQMLKTMSDYNAQIAVDCDSYLILGNTVVQDANDMHQLLPMIAEVENNTDSAGVDKKILADSGYSSSEAYEKLEDKKHLDVYVPTREQVNRESNPAGPFDKSKFDIDMETETGVCPLGYPMRKLRNGTNKSGRPYKEFTGTNCPDCPRRDECTTSKFRSVVILISDYLLRKMEDKMESDEGIEAMLIRKKTVEPVFGVLKEHLGFRRFSLRGLAKVIGEFDLLCLAYNMKKLHKYLGRTHLKDLIEVIFDLFSKLSEKRRNYIINMLNALYV